MAPQARQVRVTKRFTFEMAHALRCHDGLCAHIHGHSYVLDVTLLGTPRDEPGHPKDGMVIDFADLKVIVKRTVIDRYDHALVLHERDRGSVEAGDPLFGRTLFTHWQPTCGDLLYDRVERLEAALTVGVVLDTVRLQETATSWAEWQNAEPRGGVING